MRSIVSLEIVPVHVLNYLWGSWDGELPQTLRAGSHSWLTASKNMGTSLLYPQETELYQQFESASRALDENTDVANP